MHRPLRFLVGLVLVALFFSACNSFAKVQKSKDYDYKLTKAEEYFEKKKYRFAQVLYEELFPIFKGTAKFEVLYYKYAYCFYNQGFYREAESLFKGYLEVFPNSDKAEEVDFQRAYCYYKLSPKLELEQVNTLRAMSMMQTFISTHPQSERVKEATEIIDKSRQKLESKEYRGAQLFYNIGEFRAAALSFSRLLDHYPESASGDMYKLMVIKSYFRFAKMSVAEKQEERFEKVVAEYQDFLDRYPESPLSKEAASYHEQSINQLNFIRNEQTSSSTGR
jgi:outer membrane protein assembly factor BamD